ncbi:unnamed protein product, partial [Rotaria socialis]
NNLYPLSKTPTCILHTRLRECVRSGSGASITSLREQNGQLYTCKNINDLKNETNDRLCTVQAKLCNMSNEIPVLFEQNEFKRVQKMKKNTIIGDSTGAIEMVVWESHFNQLVLGNSFHIRLLKVRIYNDQILLIATADASFIKIEDLEDVITEVDSSINHCQTSKGRVISIENNDNSYACQACGSINIIDENNIISCNECHSRLLKDQNIIDNYLKITILTINHEEYNLRISNLLLLTILTENNNSSLNNDNCINLKIILTILFLSTLNLLIIKQMVLLLILQY